MHLALGGGAARGLAHIGAIQAIEEEGLPIASICGTSMGSLVGGLYALQPDANMLRQHFKEFVEGDVYNHARYAFIRAADKIAGKERRGSWRRLLKHGVLWGRTMAFGSMIPFDEFVTEMKALIPAKRFSDTSIPFFATGVDLSRRQEVLFYQGLIRSAIMASSAIPGVFPSIKTGDTTYVDGGWMNKVPVSPLLTMGADSVIGIDVADDITSDDSSKRSGVSTMLQAYSASHHRLQELQIANAPLMWRLPVRSLHWAEFRQVDEAAEIGYQYAKEQMPALRAMVERNARRGWLDKKIEAWMMRMYGKNTYRTGFEWRSIWEVEAPD